ncbi:pyroglutamyl-peptidase I [Nocardia rhizosphaerihabitans]|uniref:Pyroglutamyl-peptidase I n=1 Tax=Nocardia rhizosphaerihabitans TaxID=1691570 RepID=A0ABQ2L1Z5_9NOCA|nr:pyroglutamyl-peptidase I [Nocardia rhizosphaerihabitans]GGN99986.1 pyrrolidone-carboxylate peptidase [Nocardia rhizosphaerihabitans]
MNRVLLTGFGAYADEADNPSGAIARRLDGQRIDGFDVSGAVVPVDTEQIRPALSAAIEFTRPDVVILTGVAPGRTAPALERVAINVRDFPIPDIAGRTPIDEPVVTDAPAAYFTTLPVKAIVDAWRRVGIPGYVSQTAGTYLCNQVFYLARHLLRESTARVGMLHIPATPPRAAAVAMPPIPSMAIDHLEEAVRLAISIAARHEGPDLSIGGGAIS